MTPHLAPPPRHSTPEAWLPAIAGVVWLWTAPAHGWLGALFCLPAGALQLVGGVTMLLMPGDGRIAQWTAAGGVLGVLFALPAALCFGAGTGIALALVAAASILAAGWHSLASEPRYEDVPEPDTSALAAAQVALDEALLAEMISGFAAMDTTRIDSQAREFGDARELFAARGWLRDPVSYHDAPPPPDGPSLTPREYRGRAYEHLHFASEYEPREEEPGRARWLGYEKNRTAHAWVMRHAGEDRPWLLCVHGYVMGYPAFDFGVFSPEVFHEKLGYNLILPTLPLHGKRSLTRRSGRGYFGADVLDTLHAEAQAMWDLRRCLAWVRGQTQRPIGVYGVSLGGYNAALLSGLEEGLACVVAGVPVADFSRILFRHGPAVPLHHIRAAGMDPAGVRELLRAVSPLDVVPRVAHEHRHIFGGVGDRIVPPDHVRDLWRHWEQPEMVWYQGAHVTFLAFEAVRDQIRRALQSGLGSAA